jgi:hypothetical protein
MNRVGTALIFVAILAFSSVAIARADSTMVGVLMSYTSGNEGTDMIVRTADGHNHDLWFDNLKKPLFHGKELPWCPEFPCDGWPSQLVLGRTRVRVTIGTVHAGGRVIQAPTRVDLAH